MASSEDTFARLVSLAVHDLRTPLATVSGFARTLQRTPLGDPTDRYVEMMVAASNQLADLLDDVGLVSRIDAGRWEPNVQDVDSLELAREALGEVEGVRVDGAGATVRVDREATATALRQLATCALRHGGLDEVVVSVAGAELTVQPITADAGPIVLGDEPRDLGAMIAARILPALGGGRELDGGRLVVRLPT
jgi:signal transduction histidine kinase